MSIVIKTDNLSRTYQTYEKPEGLWNSVRGMWNRKYVQKTALQPTTLSIESGQIVGLVGANGAGKTTLLKLLSGLIHPSSGSAKVLGYDPWQRNANFLRKISILLGQKNQLWWDIPAADSFDLLARIYELPTEKSKNRVQELAELLDCRHVLNVQLRRLSLGERMKMEIIGSLLHDPEILFLDEPTIGLDVVAQTTIRKFLTHYVQTKRPTVILTSHYMDDIAKLANRLLLISHGGMVYDGTVNDFISKSETYQKVSFGFPEPLAEAVTINTQLSLNKGEQVFSLQVGKVELPKILEVILKAGEVEELKIEEVDFEDVIRKFLEKESRIFSAGNHH